ncbi:iron compound ABC transporter, permease protein [Oleiphilus messinensis]|uniref:Iron compound ABC transporter, permease protein n=1 Tax=Oleiphilus messinensis TaxID=141451 RepID=A0A1Y0I2Y8_9GAMM|nr:iron chelate uptake ABC transporter family permease subunit [Oleiphilus messinensis]ARU54630.1 iron compound ABC transporter, permease protein [Oleiphilus messinensis]
MIRATIGGGLVILALVFISLVVGNTEIDHNPLNWFGGVNDQGDQDLEILTLSRIPRTIALILAGISLSVAGLIMQMLVRNKFVEPATTGTVEWASLGLLLCLIFAPGLSVIIKMVVACLFALFGTGLFMLLLQRIDIRSDAIVPLVGLIYAAVIGAAIAFVADQAELMQSIWVWIQGDFSMVLQGRYELLWFAGCLGVVAYITADQFTLAGLGKNMSENLGLNYTLVFIWGILLVSVISGITVATVGVIPFLGLVVPNLVSLIVGDNLRYALPWVAVTGAALILLCDIVARLITFPYEIPIGTIMGVIGSLLFLYLLLRSEPHGQS